MSGIDSVAKSSAEKIGSIIPVLYYDIIARIIPGCAFIAAALYPNFKLTDTITFVAWLGAGYLVGLLLTGLSLPLDLLWLLVATVIERRSPRRDEVGKRILYVNARYSPFYIPKIMDKVMRKDATVANILFKMLAEATACQNLITGYVVLCAIARYYPDFPTALTYFAPSGGAMFVLFGVLFLAGAFRAVAVAGRAGNWES